MSLLKIRQFSINQTDTFTFANANVTGNLNSGNANLGNLAIANFFSGAGNNLSNIQASNITGQVANALVAGNVYGSNQANITRLGTLLDLSVSNATGTVNFTGTGNVTLGAVANLHISGGSNGYVLGTDGLGGLTWVSSSSATGNANVSGSNTHVFFNDNGSNTLGSSANFAFDKSTNTLTVTNIVGNGSGLTSLAGNSVTGTVANATYALSAGKIASGTSNIDITAANGNVTVGVGGTANIVTITSTGIDIAGYANLGSGNLTTTGNVTAGYFIGNGSSLTQIAGNSVTGTVANANFSAYSGVVTTAAQPNITSVGNLTAVTVTGNLTAGNANISGTLTVSGITTAAGGSGNISGADVISANAFIASGNINAAFYFGNGSSLTGVSAATAQKTAKGTSNVDIVTANGNITMGVGGTGNVVIVSSTGVDITGYANISANLTAANANLGNVATANYFTGTLTTAAQPNITSVGTLTSLDITGNLSAGNANLGNVATANYFTGTLTTAAQPNITSVGTLTSLAVTGDISGANLTLTGNLIISGTTTTVNSTTTRVVDPIVEQGGGANGGTLNANDGKDRGTLLHYYDGAGYSAVDAFMGWDNSNTEFGFGSNVTVANDVVTFNSFGNVRAGFFLGNGSALTGVLATSAAVAEKTAKGTSNVDIVTANGNISMAVGGTPNVVIVSSAGVDITGYANISGNLTAGNANLGNAATANFFIGSGANLANIAGGNVTGTVANANNANNSSYAGIVTGSSQGNITSVGTLISLAVSGTTNLGSVANVFISGGSANYFLKTDGSGSLSWSPLPATTIAVDSYVGNGTWTMQTLSITPLNINYTIVAIGGVFQPREAYDVTGAVITFDDPPPVDAIVEITIINGGTAGASGYVYQGINSSTTAIKGVRYLIDTTAAVTLTLPASASMGDEVGIIDATGNAGTQNITIARNGGNIEGSASNLVLNVNRSALTLVYYNGTQGWVKTQR